MSDGVNPYCYFFNDTETTEIYTLSLHDALPISPDRIEGVTGRLGRAVKTQLVEVFGQRKLLKWSIPGAAHFFVFWARSEEHTSELQSQSNLVCRLLLEKKKKNTL